MFELSDLKDFSEFILSLTKGSMFDKLCRFSATSEEHYKYLKTFSVNLYSIVLDEKFFIVNLVSSDSHEKDILVKIPFEELFEGE